MKRHRDEYEHYFDTEAEAWGHWMAVAATKLEEAEASVKAAHEFLNVIMAAVMGRTTDDTINQLIQKYLQPDP